MSNSFRNVSFGRNPTCAKTRPLIRSCVLTIVAPISTDQVRRGQTLETSSRQCSLQVQVHREGDDRNLPIDTFEARNEIEVPIPAQQWERVLTAKGGNPKIVRGNWFAFPLQFETDDRIRASRLILDLEHTDRRNPFLEPVFVTGPVAGLRDAKTVYAENK